jgi:hypothetical protein
MSHHRNAICQTSGKVRYREPRDVKFALRRADGDRHKARLNNVACGRRETSSYSCADCGGWHLTSQSAQPARSARPVSTAKFTRHLPSPAADAIRRMAMGAGLPAGIAA